MASKVLRLRYLGAAALAGAPALTYTVYAAGEKDAPEARKVKIAELPFYDNPEDKNNYDYIEEEINAFRQSVSKIRQSVWVYLDSIKETTDFVQDKLEVAKAHTNDALEYIQNDPGVLPRAGVITVAGLGGIVAGYRGGVLRKVCFSSLAMMAAASLCYPKEAISITTTGYEKVVDHARELWGSPAKSKPMTVEDRRKLYQCGGNFVVLEKVATWEEFFKEQSERLKQKGKGAKKVEAEVNETLNSKVSIWQGSITALEIDAISNAAKKTLLGGSGVDGAIHSAAGPQLKEECSTLGGCETGEAKITKGYNLPAKHVIHTVGPIGENPERLRSCYRTCLQVMKENGLRSLAFPCISTGVYGYPNENAARVAMQTVREWLEEDGNAELVDRIVFCLFLPVDVKVYEDYMQVYFPVKDIPAKKK